MNRGVYFIGATVATACMILFSPVIVIGGGIIGFIAGWFEFGSWWLGEIFDLWRAPKGAK